VRTLTFAAACAAVVLPLSGCGLTESNDSKSGSENSTITVTSTDDACTLSASSAKAGNIVFKVQNSGTKVTEFYLYAEDGLRIVGEQENIGPGITRDLVVNAGPGTYVTACKPGMTGKGIRSDFTVTGSASGAAVGGVDETAIAQATEQYADYVHEQTEELVDATTEFVASYKAGHDAEARSQYPLARVHWERIETVAESFGDLDPRMDVREADLEPGQRWTGWHRIEKDLWPPATGYTALTKAQRASYADQLLADTHELYERVEKLSYTVDQISNGSKGLLDEVATGKVTGEEEIWSHTDLYDFQANVDGARVGSEGLEPLLDVKDPALSKTIDERFDALQALLDRYRVGKDGFVSYDKVTEQQRRELSDAVNALSEPLSKMTGAITL
jgi:iron uptake system component EfeO